MTLSMRGKQINKHIQMEQRRYFAHTIKTLLEIKARLIERLRELDPDADAILALWQENDKFSDRAIAKALGRPQRTFADQMKRYRTELRKIRGY